MIDLLHSKEWTVGIHISRLQFTCLDSFLFYSWFIFPINSHPYTVFLNIQYRIYKHIQHTKAYKRHVAFQTWSAPLFQVIQLCTHFRIPHLPALCFHSAREDSICAHDQGKSKVSWPQASCHALYSRYIPGRFIPLWGSNRTLTPSGESSSFPTLLICVRNDY